jgi:two-component system NtrC family sensor kinase
MADFISRLGAIFNRNFISRHFVLLGSIIFFLIVGSALVLIFQNSRIIRKRIDNDFNQQQLVLARQAAFQIDADLQAIAGELETLEWMMEDRIDPGSIDDVMQAMIKRTQSKGVDAVGLIDLDGRVIHFCCPGVDMGLILSRLADCRGMIGGEHLTLCPQHIDRRDNTDDPGMRMHRITDLLCKKVKLYDGAEGILFANIDVTRLVARVTERIRSGKTGYAWVIDEEGTFLYHPDREFIGKNAFTARQQRKPYISFTQINHIMKDNMLQGEEGTGRYESGWHRGIEGSMTKLISYTPVQSALLPENRMWSVAVAAPVSEVVDAVRRIYRLHFAAAAAIGVGIVIFGIFAYLYQRRLSESLQRQVRHQEQYMASVLRNSVDAIIFIDEYNRVKVWNRGAEMIFGYTAEEMLGRTFHCLIPPEMDAESELRKIQQEVQEKGYIRHYRTKRMTKDGRQITIDISRTQIKSRRGESLGSTAIIRDVTDTVALEQRIYNTEKLASIGTLAAGVAHEINNPLAIILGFTDLMKEKFPEGSQEYEDLKIIEENANNAKKIVENMLGFARVTEGYEDTVDVIGGLRAVAAIVNNTLMTKKIELRMNLPDTLPRVRGDAREFQQVIFNLINNSIAATELKGGKITISAEENQDFVNISIEDEGSGIPDKFKKLVFDPFFTTKEVGKGTGLGLSLCYGIIDKYGGRISFTSVSAEDQPGEKTGTTFTVSLPVDKGDKMSRGGEN